jgi:acetyl esterase/lipase
VSGKCKFRMSLTLSIAPSRIIALTVTIFMPPNGTSIFAVALYPGHLSLADNGFGLNPDIDSHISGRTPPTFLLQNENDNVDRVEDSLSYYAALKKAGVPVEMHIYAQGGHAFGLRRTKFPATAWPQLVDTWLRTIGMVSE